MYYIMNKDELVGIMDWIPAGVDDVYNAVHIEDKRLPNYVSDYFVYWIKSRTPPKHREHAKQLLDAINAKSTKDVIDYSKGLSLTDTFWITNNIGDVWNRINLYDNQFSDVIAHTAFTGGMMGLNMSSPSPEYGTDGMLAKCWVREDGIIKLKKAGTSGFANTGREPFCEAMFCKVLDALKYNHVHYTVENYKGRLVSSCNLLTSKEVSMVPMHIITNIKTFEDVQDFVTKNKFLEDLYRMLIFDYLVLNGDRHLGNFSVLINSDTYDVLGLAPIYDNGFGCLAHYMLRDTLQSYIEKALPSLYDTFEQEAKRGKFLLKNQNNVNKLIGFKFDRTKLLGFDDKMVDAVEELIQLRVREFLSW